MQIKEKLIQKLFTDQCSREELELLLKLLQKDKRKAGPQIMIELFKQLGELPPFDENLSPRILQRVMTKIHEEEIGNEIIETNDTSILIKKQKNSVTIWLRNSAAAVLIMFASMWAFQHYQSTKDIFIQSQYGEISTFLLPDSSAITLNGNSSIQYSPNWSQGEARIVHLDGEAYFKVQKKPNSGAIFQVVTKELTVEVLGTAFNVNSRNSESVIFLEEGKVKVNTQDEEIKDVMLKPGQVLRYSSLNKKLTLPKEIATGMLTTWKDGFMEFKETALKEILEQISNSQKLEFEFLDEDLAERKFTLALPIENVDEAMSVLSKTTGTSITRNGNQYIIRQKRKN